MLEILSGGLLGGIFGGIFRLAPEVLKFFDKKNEREHELAMFSRQCELEQLRGQQKLAEMAARMFANESIAYRITGHIQNEWNGKTLAAAMEAVRTGKHADGSAVEGWKPHWAHPASWAHFTLVTNRDR